MYSVSFYDRDFVHRGIIPTIGGRFVFRNGDVSTALIRINGNSPLWGKFDLPGGHIVVKDGDTQIFSGRLSSDTDQYQGGISNPSILAECHLSYVQGMITMPSPNRAPAAQDIEAYYNTKGAAGELIFHLVRTHVAQGAIPENLTPLRVNSLETVPGKTVSINSRFKPVLEEIQQLADAGGVVYRTYMDNGVPRFLVEAPRDLSRDIRIRESNAALSAYEMSRTAPTATRVLVAGQGEGELRTLHLVEGDQTDWDVKSMIFQDRRDTDEREELQQAGEETLSDHAEEASLNISTEQVPGLRYGVHFRVGDKITVELRNRKAPVVDTLQNVVLEWDGSSGTDYTFTVGPHREDPSEAYLLSTVKRLQSELRALQAR